MRSLVYFFTTFLVLKANAFDPTSLKHFESVPPQAKMAVARFCLGEWGGILYKNTDKDFEIMRTVPGLAPVLFEVAERYEAEQEWNGHHYAWALLSKRTDATDNQQRFVRQKLESILDRNADPGGSTFKQFALTFLGNYPSVDNERLLIQYLRDTNGGPKRAILSEHAAESLGKIGTAASLVPLKDYLRRYTPPPGAKWRQHDIAIAALEQVQARLEAQQQRQATTQMKKATLPQTMASADEAVAQTENTDDMPWSVLALMVFAALGLLWLMVQGGLKARR